MKNRTDITPASAESFWAAMQALTEKMAETDRKMAETNRQMAETDRQMAETDRRMAETDRQITRLEKQIGGVSNNQGLFAEEYFYNSIKKGEKAIFGEKYDKLIKSELIEDETKIKGELDMMLINGKSVAIIEVKFKAREKHIDQMFKKVKLFRVRFPEYQNHKVYLGMASIVFDAHIEENCMDNGIAVIKQVGDAVVINDKNLKTY